MTHHCPRSNWTGPESELRRGICPRCAETTLYEDCSVRRVDKPIVFTDEQGNEFCLRTFPGHTGKHGEFWRYGEGRDATPDDLARAGYTPSAENGEVQRLCLESAKRTRELKALRALETRLRAAPARMPYPLRDDVLALLEAIDEARK